MPRNRQLTEKRILDAALQLLGKDGFENWGVNEIARKAGVDKVLIYRYYDSLAGLLSSVIQSTAFWPDPELIPDSTPEAFIGATIHFMADQPHSQALLAHPNARAALSETRRKFITDLERWTRALEQNTEGSIRPDQLERLPALIHFQISTGIQSMTARELWNQVSPPLEWGARRDWAPNDELPTELL